MASQNIQNIFLAGHAGMVGSAFYKALDQNPDVHIFTATRSECDLTNQSQVNRLFQSQHFDQVILAAAKVGGIHANKTFPADFIYQNLIIQANVIHAAHSNNINNLLFLGSSCIYPKYSDQPIQESSLLSGYLESTNEPYAIAKIAGIKMCESYNRQHGRDYRSIMPTNLYGPHDNYHPKNSHVIPALIHKFHLAKEEKLPTVNIWGSGEARRDFMHVDDLVSAALLIMSMDDVEYQKLIKPDCSHINISSGVDHTIIEIANLIAAVVGFDGGMEFDHSKSDGAPRKMMSSSVLDSLKWRPNIDLRLGLQNTYKNYLHETLHVNKKK
ncbi:GDP-L-fucose synthase [Gammaproteobacteria bacterium]|nr:GDP-L-fucose synthase [Gammaproteobacteria bacterium]